MKRKSLSKIVFIVLSFTTVMPLFAQKGSPALDPDCYFPRVGVSGEIDSIYGSANLQGLGDTLAGLPPAPGESYDRILLSGLPLGAPYLSEADGGHSFDLHHLSLKPSNLHLTNYGVQFGHFHSPHILDILTQGINSIFGGVPRIYWSDSIGNFDTSRYTDLLSTLKGDYTADGPGHVASYKDILTPYISKLSSDSLDDIVTGMVTNWMDDTRDTAYLAYYRAGQALYSSGHVALPDSISFFYNIWNNKPSDTWTGDWQGTGRKDIISFDVNGNLFYFHPERPFSLSSMAYALTHDTLIASWQNAKFYYPTKYGSPGAEGSMQAFPRPKGDVTQDMLVQFLNGGPNAPQNAAVWVFRGGPDFGSHRLTLDSVTEIMHNPWYYDPANFANAGWGGGDQPVDVGDMTGSGNRTLGMSSFFYVLGTAFDDKADMMFQINGIENGPRRGGGFDTLTADDDSLQDVIFSDAGTITDEDHAKGWESVGGVFVVHGSRKIPVHLSQKYGVSGPQPSEKSMTISPNPNHGIATLRIEGIEPGVAEISVYDILGRRLFAQQKVVDGSSFSFRLSLPTLAPGTYSLQVSDRGETFRQKMIVVR